MPKLFFGIRPPAHVRQAIEQELYPLLQKNGEGLRISAPEDWHITVHFIGEVTRLAAKKILEKLKEAPFPDMDFSIPITLGGKKPIGAFGKNALFLNVDDSHGVLKRLHEWGKEMVPVEPAHPYYRPHLTLARNPNDLPLDEIAAVLNRAPFTSTFRIGGIILFDSVQGNGRTSYVPIANRPLFEGKTPE